MTDMSSANGAGKAQDRDGSDGAPAEPATVTRADLAAAVHREVGLSRNECAAFVERILEEIAACLARGEAVKISSFGAFDVRDKSERLGRNPKTGEEAPILPRRVVSFRASNVLKARVNGAAPAPAASPPAAERAGP